MNSRAQKLKQYYNLYNRRFLTLFFIILILIILSINNYYLFHSAAEIFSCAIAYAIFIFTINTYKISKNSFFTILGIGYLFVAAIDLLHAFTYGDLIIFTNEHYDTETKFWIAARFVEVLTFLIASISLYKKAFKPNYNYIYFIYLAITATLIIDILYLGALIPVLRIEGVGITKAKMYAEFFIMIGFLISFFILYEFRNTNAISSLLMVALMIKIISEMCFILHISITDHISLIGHLMKVFSSYIIYIGIIENGIYRPYEMLKVDLIKADNKSNEYELQRQYLEEIITTNENCYDLIIENSCECIVIIRDFKIIYANTTAVNLLGATDLLDLINRNVWDFIYEYYEPQILEDKIKENINNRKFNKLDIKSMDGNIIKFEYTLNDITYRGNHAYLIILKDVSHKEEIKMLQDDLVESVGKLDKSMELNKELTEFFSNISHELKTPLNIILGSIQLILQNEEGQTPSLYLEEQKKLLNITKQNAFRLIRLVNNLIDISKFDAGYLHLNNHNCNIVSVVENIALSVKDYLKTNDITIIFDTNTEEKIMAVDCDKIERIMLNLLSNSMKFTEKGGEVWVTLTDMDKYVQISVKDTGIGIPEDKLNLIFNRFEQVDKTFTRKKEGSGIGLALVKSLVELHEGTINIRSKINEGTEFIINLPVIVLENDEYYIENFDSKADKINIEFSDIYE